MACSVSITNVGARDVSSGIARSIFVEGTATECSVIRLELTSCERPTVINDIHVASDGTWSREITEVNCPCGVIVEVKAACTQSPDGHCEEDRWLRTLECGDEPTGCPVVVVDTPVYGDCVDGYRLVTLTATITPASPTDVVVAHWDFGDGTPAIPSVSIPLIPPPSRLTTTHYYRGPGPFTAQLVVDAPTVCPVTEIVVEPPEPCLPAESTSCDLTLTPGPIEGCAGDGMSVTVHFTASPPAAGCTYHWQFGDGSEELDTTEPEVDHTYTRAGHFPTSVALYDCGCRTVRNASVDIPPCCPELEAVSASEPVGCADGGKSSANVTFVAITNPPAATGTFTWDFGDGPPPTTGSRSMTHSYSTPGRKDVRVTFTPSDPNCMSTSASTSATIMACAPGTTTDTPRSSCMDFICAALLIGALLFLTIAVLLGFIAGCSFPNTFTPPTLYVFIASAVAFGLAILLLIIWGVVCAKFNCDPLIWLIRILGFLTGLAAILAIVLGSIGNPCWLGSLFSSGYLGTALAIAVAIGGFTGCYGPRDSKG
jgi:hypothetical protein